LIFFGSIINILALIIEPKRIAESTDKPERRQRDNKDTPGKTPSFKTASKENWKINLKRRRISNLKFSAFF